jgi:hypothetical protein
MTQRISAQQRKLLWVVAAFVIPIILAKLALQQEWIPKGVTNKGELITQPMTLASVGLTEQSLAKHWLLLIVAPDDCDNHCSELLHTANNTYIALGEDVKRVKPIVLSKQDFVFDTAIFTSKAWLQLKLPNDSSLSANQPQVYIVDTLGNFVMRYSVPTDEQSLPQFGKAILSDFKKLLKYSRIG